MFQKNGDVNKERDAILWKWLRDPGYEQFVLQYGDQVVDEALNRLESGDVSTTRFGTGVRMRDDLGDDLPQSGSNAFWPIWVGSCSFLHPVCVCAQMRRDAICSHAIAAWIYNCWFAGICENPKPTIR